MFMIAYPELKEFAKLCFVDDIDAGTLRTVLITLEIKCIRHCSLFFLRIAKLLNFANVISAGLHVAATVSRTFTIRYEVLF